MPQERPAGRLLAVGFVGYPLFWAVGLGPLLWPIVAFLMALHLLARSNVRVPRGFGLWILFLAWTAVSATQLDTVGRFLGFTYRTFEYTSATLVLIYAYNAAGSFTLARARTLIRFTFAVLVMGGLLGLLYPAGSPGSLGLALLPGPLASDVFIQSIFSPSFAQVQSFLGFELARPSAPFVYTNTWGATYALLLPWAIADILDPRKAGVRPWAVALTGVSIVPAVLSVNRVMWLSVLVSIVVLFSVNRDPQIRRALASLTVVAAVLVALLSMTPLGDVVLQRLETPHSNAARLDVAEQTVEGVMRSPLVGFGAPRPFEGEGIRPPLGTQGQLWLLAFSHGIPGVGFYVLFFATMWVVVLRSSQAVWMRMTLAAMTVQLPFYEHLGIPILVVMFALAVTLREATGRAVPPSVDDDGEGKGLQEVAAPTSLTR